MTTKKKNNKITLGKLAMMIGKGFNGMDKRFEKIDRRFESLEKEMKDDFGIVKKQIDQINLNLVDVVRQEEFNKLEQRVTDVEEVLDLKVK